MCILCHESIVPFTPQASFPPPLARIPNVMLYPSIAASPLLVPSPFTPFTVSALQSNYPNSNPDLDSDSDSDFDPNSPMATDATSDSSFQLEPHSSSSSSLMQNISMFCLAHLSATIFYYVCA